MATDVQPPKAKNRHVASFTASNPTVLDADGVVHTLSEYWTAADKGLALVFVRHFGCPFCKEHVATLIKRQSEFTAAGVDIVIVGNGSPERAKAFTAQMKTPFPVVTDPSGEAYSAFRLKKAEKKSLFTPQVLLGGVRAASKGYFPKPTQGDPLQLQGQFLIDTHGVVWHADRPLVMSDIPSSDALLDVARAIWSS